jgi:hypothetical protein
MAVLVDLVPHSLPQILLEEQLALVATGWTWASLRRLAVTAWHIAREAAMGPKVWSHILLHKLVDIVLLDALYLGAITVELYLLECHGSSATAASPIRKLPSGMCGRLGHLKHIQVLKSLIRLQMVLRILSPFGIFAGNLVLSQIGNKIEH